MPLIDPNATEEIVIDDDTYTLKKQLGFYDTTKILAGSLSPADLRAIQNRSRKNGDQLDGQQASELIDTSTYLAQRNFLKIKFYLTSWSHPDLMTDENIKRIPPEHAKEILDKIKVLEVAPEAHPFRGE